MLKPDESDSVAAGTRVLQIVVAAMAVGPLVFIGIVPFIPPGLGGPRAGNLPVLSVAAIVAAATAVPLSLVLPRLVTDARRKQIAATPAEGDAARLMASYQVGTIVGAALNEGAAFLAVMAYMLERQPYALALALVLIAGVALRFPRRAAVEQWVEDQLGIVDELRRYPT
jgi:hypothetical protein